ncbi:hypothetical protein VOI54_16625 [Tamlana sp. 2201CG12-4]|uniref:hypothetical protein n=1 Tax=Tamlana sp. 2201CG12-4 TaxID=3112582 RepID=UPI002DC00DD5|nr:hypothetical protein [Tamlana sp. 2201CG12-4]MEC3908655.1 hypothetical protein [Tamlana sp. 2201CG12-4]
MRRIKLLVAIFTLFATIQGQAQQSKNIAERAKESVERINNLIKAEDPTLKLSDKQMKEALEVQEAWYRKIKEAKKTETDKVKLKEKIQTIVKEHNRKIKHEILTKEQRLAFVAGKEKVGVKK